MATATVNVEGMSCAHCKASVEKGLNNLSGVNEVSVDLDGKSVTVSYDDSAVDLTSIKKVIEQEGYTVVD